VILYRLEYNVNQTTFIHLLKKLAWWEEQAPANMVISKNTVRGEGLKCHPDFFLQNLYDVCCFN